MTVKYRIVKSPLKSESAKNSRFVQLVHPERVSNECMIARISEQCTLSEANIVAVFQAYETNLEMEFSRGNSVSLLNLGTITPCLTADFDAENRLLKDSLRFSKLKLTGNHSFLRRSKLYQYSCKESVDYSDGLFERRAARLERYFAQNKPEITSAVYVRLNGCTRSTANRDLARLVREKKIVFREYGRMRVYEKSTEIE